MNLQQRLEKITSVEDIDTQILLAKKYQKRLRAQSKSPKLTLDEKLALGEKAKLAEHTFRQLRRASFDIEDAILEGRLQSWIENSHMV